MRKLFNRFKAALSLVLYGMPALSFAQATGSSSSTVTSITSGLCSLIGPFLGHSQVIAILFILGLAVILVLWMLNENKEGVIVWVLRSGIVIGILVNIATLPTLFGFASPCAGYIS
jgi:hypothetical protein